MERILITGSNRGVGLALVKEYLGREDTQIIATCRKPDNAAELQQLARDYAGRVTIVALDINDEASIHAAAETVAGQFDSIDILYNNAGIYPEGGSGRQFGQLEYDAVNHVLTTNAVGAVIVTQAFAHLLKEGNNPRVVMVSSKMGSITLASTSGISYRMSKAAMNMAVKVISQVLYSDGITVITTHPGHVSTDMGGSGAPVTPEESAKGLIAVTDGLTLSQTGHFFNYTGEVLPW